MKASFRIFRIRGIDVKLHLTLIILFLLPVMVLSSEGVGSAIYFLLILVALFGSVLIHELSHSFVAMRSGIRVREIILWPLGGIASVGLVKDPVKEFKISVAGPLASFAIGFALLSVLLAAVGLDAIVESFFSEGFPEPPSLLNFAILAAYLNLILGAFNLFLPIFPMDGGRVLRSMLGMVMDRVKATRIAVGVGQAFLVVFIFFAISFGLWLWLAIGIFLFIAGLTELQLTEMGDRAEKADLKGAVKTGFMVLHPDLKVSDLLKITVPWQSLYPVLDDKGRPVGVVEPATLGKKGGRVGDVMKTDPPTAHLGDDKEELLAKVLASGYALIVDGKGRLQGVLTSQNLRKAMQAEETKG